MRSGGGGHACVVVRRVNGVPLITELPPNAGNRAGALGSPAEALLERRRKARSQNAQRGRTLDGGRTRGDAELHVGVAEVRFHRIEGQVQIGCYLGIGDAAMKIAEKFGRPVFTLIDLVGAAPGLGAEERGQAEAIARNLREMSRLRVPTIATITGEGGSGGALGLAVSDRVLMLENAVYSVISPEGCASILWRDASNRALAAEAMKTTSPDVKALGCVDDVVPEPVGGAHLDEVATFAMLDEKLRWHLADLRSLPVEEMVRRRQAKFRTIAQFYTS